jgi:hypothetical protein
MSDPGERIVPEEEIAQGAAAERGDTAEEADAEPVHAPAAGRERGGHALRCDRDQRQQMQHAIARRHAPHRLVPFRFDGTDAQLFQNEQVPDSSRKGNMRRKH